MKAKPPAWTLLVLVSLTTGLVGTASGDPVSGEPDFVYSTDPDDLVIRARKVLHSRPDARLGETTSWTIHIYGDARIEMEPAASWLEARIYIQPATLDQLLRSLDGALRLSAHLSLLPAPERGSFVEVHLTRYESAEGEIIQYLDAIATVGLEVALEDLSLLRKWVSLRHAVGPVFVSGPPWPGLCEPARRLALGLGVMEPRWCSAPAFRRVEAWMGMDAEQREAIGERLRRRLRLLPRGIPDE